MRLIKPGDLHLVCERTDQGFGWITASKSKRSDQLLLSVYLLSTSVLGLEKAVWGQNQLPPCSSPY